MKKNTGITIISLTITIIILLILSGIVLKLALGNNGIFGLAEETSEKTKKETAIEIIRLKITNIEMLSYAETEHFATLQYLSDKLCEDKDIEYVEKNSKLASLEKINVSDVTSIFVKLKEYSYEFEINNSLKIVAIDGEIIDFDEETINISKKEYDELKTKISELEYKLENKKVKKIYLGTYNSYQVNTINVSKYEGYQNFTMKNFVIGDAKIANSKSVVLDNYFRGVLGNGSYNRNSGVLTLEKTADAHMEWMMYINYSVYLLLGDIE